MKVNRAELDQALRTVQPAIYDKKTVEELACVWFNGAGLFAYDGEIGIVVPFKSGLEFGVKADVLLPVVAAMTAPEIDLDLKGDTLTVKAGRSRASMATLPLKRKPAYPQINMNEYVRLEQDLLDALKLGNAAVSNVSHRPDFLGTTLIAGKDGLDLFTSDGSTATWLVANAPEGWPEGRFAWPRRFCEQLVKLGKPGDTLHLAPGCALLKRQDGARLLGNDLMIDQPIDFKAMFNRMLPKDYGKQMVAIPQDLPNALKRIGVVLPGDDGVRLEVKDKEMQLDATGAKGVVQEVLPLDQDAEPVAVRITLQSLRRVLDHTTLMLPQPTVMIVEHPKTGFLHLISCSSAPKSEGGDAF